MRKTKFLFENLDVWQKTMDFSAKVIEAVEKIETNRKHYRVIEQLEAAATSIALNIAEGKGRYSKKEFIQFLYVARGSLYETITLLILFHRMNWINDAQLEEFEMLAEEISKMISNLIVSIRKSF